ncbi:hypothetical protein ACYZTL_16460 [Pseudomonas sp. LB3P81]
MKQWIAAVFGLTFTMTANAQIDMVSGDFDITPQQDYMQGLMCNDPMMFFKILDLAAQGLDENSQKMKAHKKILDQQINRGNCVSVPPSSVWVIGIRTAKISGSARQESLYGLAKVRVQGRTGYTFPDYVGQTGQLIIQTGRQDNQKNGRGVYQ